MSTNKIYTIRLIQTYTLENNITDKENNTLVFSCEKFNEFNEL